MRVNLPIVVKEEFDEATGKIVYQEGELPVDIDTSFLAHLKWEEQFAKDLGVDLQTYTDRVFPKVKSGSVGISEMASVLKVLYCYVNSPELPTFKDFLRLFKLSVTEKLLSKVAVVFEEIGKTVGKN
jgi:hypothetical protein